MVPSTVVYRCGNDGSLNKQSPFGIFRVEKRGKPIHEKTESKKSRVRVPLAFYLK